MDSMVDSLFDQYERGRMTRRHLVQALAALVLPAMPWRRMPPRLPLRSFAACPSTTWRSRSAIFQRSFAFYERLFGVTKGWPATDAGTGIHMDLPDGYISIDSVAAQKGVITHFAVAVDHMDRDAAKRLADKINQRVAGCQSERCVSGKYRRVDGQSQGSRRLFRANLVEGRTLIRRTGAGRFGRPRRRADAQAAVRDGRARRA